MCRVGGIHFSGASGNSSRASSAWASSSRNAVRQVRVDLEGVPEAELPVLEAGLLGEVLVEQLATRHRVRGLDRVGGGQVVVLAGVDDDPGAGVHLPAEPLVDEGPDRVDVAEQDPVHRVVEHHVQPLEPGQRGDLRHAQPGGVVGQPDVAAELLAGLVERGPHEPEVLLRRVGAGEALPGRALGHVVEQRLAGGADHRDHVGALAGGRLGLRDVLVDVAGRDDQVDPRPLRRVAVPLDQPVALAAAPVDALRCPAPDLLARGRPGAGRVAALGQPEAHRAGGRLLRQRRRGRRPRRAPGRPTPAARRRAPARRRRGRRRRAGSPTGCRRGPRRRARPAAASPAPPRRWCAAGPG